MTWFSSPQIGHVNVQLCIAVLESTVSIRSCCFGHAVSTDSDFWNSIMAAYFALPAALRQRHLRPSPCLSFRPLDRAAPTLGNFSTSACRSATRISSITFVTYADVSATDTIVSGKLMSVSATAPRPEERRNSPRYRTSLHIDITLGTRNWHGRLLDVSREGLSFAADARFEQDEIVEVSLPCMAFDQPAGFTRLRGRVCHCNGRRTGIEFVELAPAESARILELLYRAISARKPI